jgi:hypothetical protein
MNIFSGLEASAKKLFSGIAESAGTAAAKAAAKNPTVQGALDDMSARLERAEDATKIAAAVAGVVVAFYFLPRFENPIPRIFRKGSRR